MLTMWGQKLLSSVSLTILFLDIKLECEVGAAMLDTNSLSEEALTNSLKCEAVEADCVTTDGAVFPAKCIFPFNYKGRRYQACTDREGSNKYVWLLLIIHHSSFPGYGALPSYQPMKKLMRMPGVSAAPR